MAAFMEHIYAPLLISIQNFSSDEKKKSPSIFAFSAESEPWIAFAPIDSAYKLRIVPFSAFDGSVAPISFLKSSTALSFSSIAATIGPDDIKSTSSP